MYDFDGFKKWMEDRGRDPDTAEEYVKDLKIALDHPQGPIGRLKQRNLAPKTLRRTMASLRAWCKYTKDQEFLTQLQDVRLPPPERVVAKMPLTQEEWARLLEEIDKAEYITEPERAVIGCMARRGFRIGDVLRMTRLDVTNALRSGVLSFTGKRRKRTEYTIKNFKPYLEILVNEPDWQSVYELLGTRGKARRSASAAMAVSRALKELGAKAGIPRGEMHAHRLRRTVAVWYLKACGGDLEKLRAYMDWESIDTAANYTDFHRREELDEFADNMIPKNTKED